MAGDSRRSQQRAIRWQAWARPTCQVTPGRLSTSGSLGEGAVHGDLVEARIVVAEQLLSAIAS